MKLCMISPFPPPYGGIANWSLLVSEYIQKKDDIELYTLNIAPSKRGIDGRSLWDRVVVQGLAMFKHKHELSEMIKKDKIDVIHMTTSGQLASIRDNLLLGFAKRKRVPTVYHLRFGRIPEIAQKNNWEWKLIKRAMLRSSMVIPIDMATYRAIKKYAPEVNARYVPNPFDMSKVFNICQSAQQKEVIFVGWVLKTKGIEELIDAWNLVSNKFPDWTLRVVGPYSEEYMQELRERQLPDTIIFDGEKSHEDALKIVNNGSIFVLPSYTEGFPNAVLEAMALSKPIIATCVGAIPEMLEECGVVIPPYDVHTLKIELERLMEDENLRISLGDKAKSKLLKEYDIEKVFQTYLSIWTGLSKDES